MCAIEDAGWEVRDVLMWVYGSGFPKSLDVSKALDKREGAEREVIGVSSITGRRLSSFAEERNDSASGFYGEAKVNHATAPATDAHLLKCKNSVPVKRVSRQPMGEKWHVD